MPNDPINLSDPTAEYNYEEERYRQNDPPFDAYRIYNAYIPNKIFSAEIVRECLDRMISDYALDLTGIEVPGSLEAFAHDLSLSSAWRWQVIEGLNGFLKLRIFPDTVKHPHVRRGYVALCLMYLPKRGDIYEEDTEIDVLLDNCRSHPRRDWSEGTLLALLYPCAGSSAAKHSDDETVLYCPEIYYRFAVVIGPHFVKDKPAGAVPIAPAASLSPEDCHLISEEELRRLFRIFADYYAASAVKTADCSAESSNAGTDRAGSGEAPISELFGGNLELLSVYYHSSLIGPPYCGCVLGTLDEAAFAAVQRYYNSGRAKVSRAFIDKECRLYWRDDSTGVYCDARGCRLEVPDKSTEALSAKTADVYAAVHHPNGYLTLLLI